MQASNLPRPYQAGDPITLIGPGFQANGFIAALVPWEWIRYRIGPDDWLDICVNSGFASWTVLCRLSNQANDTECDLIAETFCCHEKNRSNLETPSRGKIDTIAGIAETYTTDWKVHRTE